MWYAGWYRMWYSEEVDHAFVFLTGASPPFTLGRECGELDGGVGL